MSRPGLWKSQYHWCQCCWWSLLAWMTRLESEQQQQQQLPHTLLHSQHVFYNTSPTGGGLPDDPTPRAHANFNDWSLSSWLRWEGRQQTTEREREKKRRGRKERRGQSHKVRVMSSLLFSAVRSVACASRERTGGVTGGLAGTDVLTQWTRTWLVAYSLKVKGADFPFFWETKKTTAKSHVFPPVGLYQGKMLLRQSGSDTAWFTSC